MGHVVAYLARVVFEEKSVNVVSHGEVADGFVVVQFSLYPMETV